MGSSETSSKGDRLYSKLFELAWTRQKHFFQLHGVNAAEEVVLRKKLRRKEMVAFFEKAEPTVVALEACGGSHHWARLLHTLDHDVKLISPQYVKPYVSAARTMPQMPRLFGRR